MNDKHATTVQRDGNTHVRANGTVVNVPDHPATVYRGGDSTTTTAPPPAQRDGLRSGLDQFADDIPVEEISVEETPVEETPPEDAVTVEAAAPPEPPVGTDLEFAEMMAWEFLEEHGLTDEDWTFVWMNRKTALGTCNFARREIALSRVLTERNSEERVRDTVLHEVAHAIAGRAAGHGKEWQRIAISLGVEPRMSSPGVSADHKWEGTCPNCGIIAHQHRLTRSSRESACAKCCDDYNGGKHSDEYRFEWLDTHTGEVLPSEVD